MAEETKQQTDKEITLTLKESEIFQLNLCVMCRSAYATQKWSCASSKVEQDSCEAQLQYLGQLSTKLKTLLIENGGVENEETKN